MCAERPLQVRQIADIQASLPSSEEITRCGLTESPALAVEPPSVSALYNSLTLPGTI